MKIAIGGVEYPYVHPAEASNTQLIVLHRQSGLTFDVIMSGIDRLGELSRDAGDDPAAYMIKVLSDIEVLLAVGALVFLARWAAGERPTFEEATDVPFTSISFIREPGDEGEVEDAGEGEALPGSVPGGNRAARRAASTRSRSATSGAALPVT